MSSFCASCGQQRSDRWSPNCDNCGAYFQLTAASVNPDPRYGTLRANAVPLDYVFRGWLSKYTFQAWDNAYGWTGHGFITCKEISELLGIGDTFFPSSSLFLRP